MKEGKNKKKNIVKPVKIILIVLVLAGIAIWTIDRFSAATLYAEGDLRMVKLNNSPQYKNEKFKNAVPWEFPSLGKNISAMQWESLLIDQSSRENYKTGDLIQIKN